MGSSIDENGDVTYVMFGEKNIVEYNEKVLYTLAYQIFTSSTDEKGCECCACYEKKETLLKVHDASRLLNSHSSFELGSVERLNLYDKIIKHNLQYRAHVVCDTCFFDWFILANKKECPNCTQKVEKDRIVEMVEDLGKARMNELLNLVATKLLKKEAEENIKDLYKK